MSPEKNEATSASPHCVALQDETRAKLVGRRVVASVSGGKDSAALSLWLTENGIEHDRVFADTGWEHDDTYAYLRGPLTKALGPINEVRCERTVPCPRCASGREPGGAGEPCRLCRGESFLAGMAALAVHKGMFPSRVRRFCTQELKVFPLAKFVKARAAELDCEIANAVGIRAEESAARSKLDEWEWQETFDCEVWRPLLRWTLEDVVAIHKRHALAPNPLYLRGASRVGCWPCIYAKKEEVRLIAETDPARIDLLRVLEAVVDDARRERREREREREQQEEQPRKRPAFFGLWQLGEGTRACAPIDKVVAWSRTAEGGRNLALFAPGPPDEGCMRWGLCETSPERAS